MKLVKLSQPKQPEFKLHDLLHEFADAIEAANETGGNINDFVLILKSEEVNPDNMDEKVVYLQPISFSDRDVVQTLMTAVQVVINNQSKNLI